MEKRKGKRRGKAGFTLVEMLASVLILALLVVGMGSGMSAAVRVYRDSIFESDSASLAAMLNNSLSDLLRYAEDLVTADKNGGPFLDRAGMPLPTGDSPGAVNFVFSNLEYGVQQAYFYTPTQEDGTVGGPLQLKTLTDTIPTDLLNQGAYPALQVGDFTIEYDAPQELFRISYTISSTSDLGKTHDVQCTVRLLNPPSAP